MSLVAFIIFLGKIDDLVCLCGILKRPENHQQFSLVQFSYFTDPTRAINSSTYGQTL